MRDRTGAVDLTQPLRRCQDMHDALEKAGIWSMREGV